MTNALQIFNFQDVQVRTVVIDDEPHFVARDVAEILGYSATSLKTILKVIAHVPAEWKGRNPIPTPSGEQEMLTLSEHGLYFFLGRSDKPLALPLQKFVAGEVLPAIRKTGSYSVVPREPLTEIDRFAAMMGEMMPALKGRVLEIAETVATNADHVIEIAATVATNADRLTAVEERQKEIDPQVIDAYRVKLHHCKELLIEGTKKKPQPVTYPGFWRELKAHCKVGSFAIENQAALTVPLMEKAFAYAVRWCKARGVNASTLFDDVPANVPA